MKRISLVWILAITANCLLSSSCSIWKTIDDPKWGFKIDMPRTLRDKGFERDYLWVHENAQMRVIVDFGKQPSKSELGSKQNFRQIVEPVNGYNAVFYFYDEESNLKKTAFGNVVTLIFQEGPETYGSGTPPFFRVEYVSDNDLETAFKILRTVRFYQS